MRPRTKGSSPYVSWFLPPSGLRTGQTVGARRTSEDLVLASSATALPTLYAMSVLNEAAWFSAQGKQAALMPLTKLSPRDPFGPSVVFLMVSKHVLWMPLVFGHTLM